MYARIQLYSSPISDCSARLRIALNLKGFPYEIITVKLSSNQNHDAKYQALNSANTVPTLIVHPQEDFNQKTPMILIQSMAALEYLDEAFPDSYQLLPPITEPDARAGVRSLVGIVATDIHPLTTHRVGRAISARFPCPESKISEANGNRDWDLYWISEGLSVYEKVAKKTAGKYSFGDNVTMADVYLMPELWTAERLGINLSQYPTIQKVYKALSAIFHVADARQNPSSEL